MLNLVSIITVFLVTNIFYSENIEAFYMGLVAYVTAGILLNRRKRSRVIYSTYTADSDLEDETDPDVIAKFKVARY